MKTNYIRGKNIYKKMDRYVLVNKHVLQQYMTRYITWSIKFSSITFCILEKLGCNHGMGSDLDPAVTFFVVVTGLINDLL